MADAVGHKLAIEICMLFEVVRVDPLQPSVMHGQRLGYQRNPPIFGSRRAQLLPNALDRCCADGITESLRISFSLHVVIGLVFFWGSKGLTPCKVFHRLLRLRRRCLAEPWMSLRSKYRGGKCHLLENLRRDVHPDLRLR